MREILFKAKTSNGKWVQGLLAHKDNKWYISNKEGMPFAFEVRPETIGQYTGLKDKNGNKIWENDIIKPYDTVTNEGYIIGWDNEMGAFVFCDINTNDSLYFLVGHYIESIQPVEVIGNIFDNSELLNADNEASQQAHQEVLKLATE